MVSQHLLTISGSSAEVGSSNSMIFGFMHQRARDGDALLLGRPNSWPGNLAACSGIFTRLKIVHGHVFGLGAWASCAPISAPACSFPAQSDAGTD